MVNKRLSGLSYVMKTVSSRPKYIMVVTSSYLYKTLPIRLLCLLENIFVIEQLLKVNISFILTRFVFTNNSRLYGLEHIFISHKVPYVYVHFLILMFVVSCLLSVPFGTK